MKIIIDEAACDGCSMCAKVCPQMILEVVNKKARVKDESRCMGCFGCEDECKAGAVRLIRGPQGVSNIHIESPPAHINTCDVAVVGAGPAGLGAAITCAKAGLHVVLFERLPNRKISHHADGGVLFTFPGITSIEIDEKKVVFPELDITLSADFTKKCQYLGLLGPEDLSTGDIFPKGLRAFAGNKDGFVEALINEAENTGVKIWFNAKVIDVLKEKGKISGVKLTSGEEVRSKVVVTADGVFGTISEKAGMDICRDDLWYGCVLAFEYDNTRDLPGALYYLNGDMQMEEDMLAALGGVGITEVIHVMMAFFSRKKTYPAKKPMDHYVEKLIHSDERVNRILGDALEGVKPKMLTGCRAVLRGKSNTDTVGHGVISVGDAWVDDGEIGNIPALGNGVYAGRIIVEAAKKNDFSKEALGSANNFLTKKLLSALSKNKDMKLLGVKHSEDELKLIFRFMQHMNYPVMLFGSPMQQGLMFSNFFARNLFRFIRHPRLAKSLF
jgi:flavin-dependent dehydrogenase/NAD-dependent dihydropyrimidine dehydrogenase PreA subunit